MAMKDYNKLKRQEKQICRGLTEDRKQCRNIVEDGKQCCNRSHADMENYTDEMFENVKKCKFCPRPRWRYFEGFDRCSKCQEKLITSGIKFCMGEQQNGQQCRIKVTDGKRFCLRNHSYMEEYTDAMLNDLKRCKSCRQKIYAGYFSGENKTCNNCVKRGEKNREITREKKKN